MPDILRALLARVAMRASGWSQLVDPDKVVRSIPERWLDPALRRHVVSMEVIRPAAVEQYSFADTLPPSFRREMHFARRHVYQLRDVTVNARTGACVAPSLYFQESFGSLRRCLLEKPFPLSKEGRVTRSGTVTCVNAASYYHFLLEEVPRLLWALHCHKGLAVLVHASAPRYAREILERICAGHGAELGALEEDAIQVASYVFTQAEAYSGFVNRSDIELLRKSFLTPVGKASPAEKIYISRRGGSRSFANEEEVVSLMLESGFQVCALETIDFPAQVDLFRRAAVVVAPHGAGLSNLLWCEAGTRVLEIFSPRYFNDCYARLSSQLQLAYTPLWAAETRGWGEVELERVASFIAGSDVAGARQNGDSGYGSSRWASR